MEASIPNLLSIDRPLRDCQQRQIIGMQLDQGFDRTMQPLVVVVASLEQLRDAPTFGGKPQCTGGNCRLHPTVMGERLGVSADR